MNDFNSTEEHPTQLRYINLYILLMKLCSFLRPLLWPPKKKDSSSALWVFTRMDQWI